MSEVDSSPEVPEESPSSEDTNEQVSEDSGESETPAQPDEESDKPESNDEVATKSTKGRSSALQKIIDSKYQGDEDKFADAIWQSYNSTAAIAKELAELKAGLIKQHEVEAKEEPLDTNEDYKELTEEITALNSDLESNQKERDSWLKEYNELQFKNAKLDGQFEIASPEQRQILAQKIDKNLSRIELLKEKWNSSNKSDREIQRSLKTLESQRKQVEARIKESKAKQSQQWKEDLKEQQSFLKSFNSEVDEAIKAYGVPTDTKFREKVYKLVKAEAVSYLTANPTESLPEDFVAKSVDEYFDTIKFSKATQFKEMSKAKVETLSKPGAPPTQLKSSTGMPKFKNGAEAREWVRKQVELKSRG
jgi:chromosome segregation ATPase